jgi:hypothetical protein
VLVLHWDRRTRGGRYVGVDPDLDRRNRRGDALVEWLVLRWPSEAPTVSFGVIYLGVLGFISLIR